MVQAFNQVGSGPLSEPVSAQTMEDGKHFEAVLYYYSKHLFLYFFFIGNIYRNVMLI